MKRTVLKSTIALLVFSLLAVVACKKKNEEPQKVTDNYIAAENGQFIQASMPSESGTADVRPSIVSITGNNTVITGGTNILKIDYNDNQDDVKEILVSIKGIEGYYVVQNPEVKASTILVPILLSQEVEGDFTIIVALKDSEGNISSQYEVKVETIEAGTGDLQVSLTWDQFDDVDLHLELPNGEEIYYADLMGLGYDTDELIWAKLEEQYGDVMYDWSDEELMAKYKEIALEQSIEGYHSGYLDVDSNPDCDIDSINNENIFFDDNSKLLNGEYIVRVDFYSDCVGEVPTNYTVSTRYKGDLIVPTSGTNPYTGTLSTVESNYGEQGAGVEAMRFEIGSTDGIVKLACFKFESNSSVKSSKVKKGR